MKQLGPRSTRRHGRGVAPKPTHESTPDMIVRVARKFESLPSTGTIVDCTSNSGRWKDLSPFILPGGPLYAGHVAKNMENAWQFAKVYATHADSDGNPTCDYWAWATAGWGDARAHRYPMGKGAKPLYSLWNGNHLGYLEARRRIYAPLYARAVVKTEAFAALQKAVDEGTGTLYLRDYDGYDHTALGMSFADVFDEPRKKMGHAFVLAMLLTRWEDERFSATHWLSYASAENRG